MLQLQHASKARPKTDTHAQEAALEQPTKSYTCMQLQKVQEKAERRKRRWQDPLQNERHDEEMKNNYTENIYVERILRENVWVLFMLSQKQTQT